MMMETPVILNLQNVHFTDEQFDHLCQADPDWSLEKTAQGELIMIPSAGGISGKKEADLIRLV